MRGELGDPVSMKHASEAWTMPLLPVCPRPPRISPVNKHPTYTPEIGTWRLRLQVRHRCLAPEARFPARFTLGPSMHWISPGSCSFFPQNRTTLVVFAFVKHTGVQTWRIVPTWWIVRNELDLLLVSLPHCLLQLSPS